MREITLEIKDDVLPLCPHCGVELKKLHATKIQCPEGGAKLKPYYRYIYFCPSCKKSLGITHTRGIL
jgi:predicted RNA-binding Zn-ribbon protein involved in translation (DUF1610 family)